MSQPTPAAEIARPITGTVPPIHAGSPTSPSNSGAFIALKKAVLAALWADLSRFASVDQYP